MYKRQAYKAQSALDLAAAGLLQQNESSANRVIADDEELDELEMTVDKMCIRDRAWIFRSRRAR